MRLTTCRYKLSNCSIKIAVYVIRYKRTNDCRQITTLRIHGTFGLFTVNSLLCSLLPLTLTLVVFVSSHLNRLLKKNANITIFRTLCYICSIGLALVCALFVCSPFKRICVCAISCFTCPTLWLLSESSELCDSIFSSTNRSMYVDKDHIAE